MLIFFSECGKWSLSADVTSLLAGSVSTSPGSNTIIFFTIVTLHYYNCNFIFFQVRIEKSCVIKA
jgi:hypothetical protein